MDERHLEIWRRLKVGTSKLKDIPLSTRHGRLDLRFSKPPKPHLLRDYAGQSARSAFMRNRVLICGAEWKDLDLSNSELDSLALIHCTIENCLFEGASLRHLYLRGARISNSSFAFATLQDAALGHFDGPQSNRFCNVEFGGADLRGSTHGAATFVDCCFVHARLDGVDFRESRFEGRAFDESPRTSRVEF